jgi:hypothetical protein
MKADSARACSSLTAARQKSSATPSKKFSHQFVCIGIIEFARANGVSTTCGSGWVVTGSVSCLLSTDLPATAGGTDKNYSISKAASCEAFVLALRSVTVTRKR